MVFPPITKVPPNKEPEAPASPRDRGFFLSGPKKKPGTTWARPLPRAKLVPSNSSRDSWGAYCTTKHGKTVVRSARPSCALPLPGGK